MLISVFLSGLGIIPARAGFTCNTSPLFPSSQDHPRSRGVYAALGPVERRFDGSSPLARGLREGTEPHPTDSRIIPARAGFTPFGPAAMILAWDHPRSRGVYHTMFRSPETFPGSSPLARGLRDLIGLAASPARIIPARAGFTHARHSPGRSWWIIPARAGFTVKYCELWPRPQDHPRSRGVYSRLCFAFRVSCGSSPLARGLLVVEYAFRNGEGDHPRSRGVYVARGPGANVEKGSSPLARGLPAPDHVASALPGIIPARAGFTRRPGDRAGTLRDHPRSRGVYPGRPRAEEAARGSSPLARGLRMHRCHCNFLPGIIPARAGFTPAPP